MTGRSKGRRRHAGVVLPGMLLWIATPIAPVLADHGSWNHHHLHFGESGSSQYWAYTDVDATDSYDYGHVALERYSGTTLLYRTTATCGLVNETCDFIKTLTKYWPQTHLDLVGAACAKDGSHHLPGEATIYASCSPQGLNVHYHEVTLN